MRQIVLALTLAIVVVFASPGGAQTSYFAGKTIEIIVPTAVGGPSDILNRSFAPFLEKHIVGNPTVRIRNIPGGGTVLGSNWFAANAKSDGLTLLASPVGSKIAYVIRTRPSVTISGSFAWSRSAEAARCSTRRRAQACARLLISPRPAA